MGWERRARSARPTLGVDGRPARSGVRAPPLNMFRPLTWGQHVLRLAHEGK
jgi:hypothetical protein